MRTGILWWWRVRKRLCVSVLGGKRSIYFLLNIRYLFIYIYIYKNIRRSSDRAIERSSDRRSAVNITGKVGGKYYWLGRAVIITGKVGR